MATARREIDRRERRKEIARRYYLKHRKKMLAANRRWRAKNHEHYKAYKREYVARNRERVRQYQRDYHRRNPEARRLRSKKHWRKIKSNPALLAKARAKGRAKYYKDRAKHLNYRKLCIQIEKMGRALMRADVVPLSVLRSYGLEDYAKRIRSKGA